MKASELINKLSYEVMMRGDLELSFSLLDKDWNETKINPQVYVEHELGSIKISLKTE